MNLSRREKTVLLVLALFGLAGPNAVFLHAAFHHPGQLRDALANPVSLVFIAEAFLLMVLFAWLLGKWTGHLVRDGLVFVALSLAGSMAFSVPAVLWWLARRQRPVSGPADVR